MRQAGVGQKWTYPAPENQRPERLLLSRLLPFAHPSIPLLGVVFAVSRSSNKATCAWGIVCHESSPPFCTRTWRRACARRDSPSSHKFYIYFQALVRFVFYSGRWCIVTSKVHSGS